MINIFQAYCISSSVIEFSSDFEHAFVTLNSEK